ncbi:MAG: protein kinase domain-containing protein, partial [Planctomycetota bacterium]
ESAFASGVLHRDIKPSNCFVSSDGSVKVGDFGLSVSTLARTDTFVTAHGKIMGTPAYSSPEQLRGDTLDVRSDIYSVGATLFSNAFYPADQRGTLRWRKCNTGCCQRRQPETKTTCGTAKRYPHRP